MKNGIILGLFGLLFLVGSCKTRGCTDPFADNYDALADLNDGTCSYSTDLVFYLNDERKAYWDDKPEFYAPFHLFVDGNKIGEISVSAAAFQTYETAPNCETTTGGILKYKHIMTDNIGELRIYIKDQLNNEHGSVSIYTTNGECQGVLL